jgi:hypothetical protein
MRGICDSLTVIPTRPPVGVSGSGSTVRSDADWARAGVCDATKVKGANNDASNRPNKYFLMIGGSYAR